MLDPHIFGSSLVICFISLRISKQSFRFCSSATLLRNSVTLASFTLVLTSAFAMSVSNSGHIRSYPSTAHYGKCIGAVPGCFQLYASFHPHQPALLESAQRLALPA